MDECDEENAISLSWGRREIRIAGEETTQYVFVDDQEMTVMQEASGGEGAGP